MHELQIVLEFARQMGWDLQRMLRELDAEVVYGSRGRRILGFAVVLRLRDQGVLRQVVLRERFGNTRLQPLLLAYGCTHLLLGSDGITLCGWKPEEPPERTGWLGASILLVPDAPPPTSPAGTPAPGQPTASDALPSELVELRHALGPELEHLESAEPADQQAIMAAYGRWLNWLQDQTATDQTATGQL